MKIPVVIWGEELATAICEATGLDAAKVARIIIDAKVGDIARIYVEMIGEKSLLDVDWSVLAGVKESG